MIKDDTLWKGILENVFDDFLRFTFDDADNLFDIEKGFQFLDKELEQLFPEEEGESPKFVDKLVKVFTKTGKEEWLLVHIEVQGYDDKDFARRMFTYFYRILDKYEKPITAIAIFTDTNKNFHPKEYKYEHLGTSNVYKFNTYKILEQDEEALTQSENPFAIVVLTVLLAIKRKKLDDEDLYQLKLQIFRNLYRRNIDPKKMRGLSTFLNLYVHFAKPETGIKFEQEIHTLTQNRTTMGIEEMVLERAEKKGIKKGIEKGMQKGREVERIENKTEFVKTLLLLNQFNVGQIANLVKVPEAFVIDIKNGLK